MLGLRRRRSSSTAAGSSEGAGAYRQANEDQLQYAAEPATSQPTKRPNKYGLEPFEYNGKSELLSAVLFGLRTLGFTNAMVCEGVAMGSCVASCRVAIPCASAS